MNSIELAAAQVLMLSVGRTWRSMIGEGTACILRVIRQSSLAAGDFCDSMWEFAPTRRRHQQPFWRVAVDHVLSSPSLSRRSHQWRSRSSTLVWDCSKEIGNVGAHPKAWDVHDLGKSTIIPEHEL